MQDEIINEQKEGEQKGFVTERKEPLQFNEITI